MKNNLRGIFYIGVDVIEKAIEDTTKGIVLISYQVGKYRSTNPNNELNWEPLQLAFSLPCNIAAIHFCFSNRAHCMLAQAAVSLIPAHIRAKTRIHFGAHFECQYLLSTYGIPREAMPFQHPGNELDLTWQKYWFQQRQEEDQRKLQLMQQPRQPQSQSQQSEEAFNHQGIDKHIKYLNSRCKGKTPMDDDVLCVGRKVNRKGNERYMALVSLHVDAYNNGSPRERPMIVDSIMREVQKYGCFLKQDTTSESGGWIAVPDKEIRQKVGQTFRNLRNRKGSSSSQATNDKATVLEASDTTASATMIIDQFTPRDVLFGSKMKNHTGNQRLRELIQNVQVEYDAANRGEKLKIAQQLMDTIKKEGGRFLKPLDNDGRWEVVADKDAIRK
ncbi:MAG: hypothetical protein SGBAC_012921, partial [Bacillariaceae sp.]